MTIKIEKETTFDIKQMKTITTYFIWVDNKCVYYADSEDEAKNAVEQIKSDYKAPTQEVIYEETI